MFSKVLIANRGEIACRIQRTLRRMGIASVAVYSEADAHARHVREADEAVGIGQAHVADSYLRGDRVIEAARRTGAQAIHPGYGFLSESAAFAAACAEAGIRFIGPSPEQIRRFGLKHEARALATELGLPLLPGTPLLDSLAAARTAADAIGYPVMLKSTAGGGGIGLRACPDAAALEEAFEAVQRLSRSHFASGGVFLERFLAAARHIEVQVFGDGRGEVLALGERDCSVQRRNQKVIEETPAPGLSDATRAALADAARRLLRAVNYESAGTVEFVLDAQTEQFYFLEVNTRLQVEHGVTEQVTGIDLVEWMVRQAAGELQLPPAAPAPQGASIQVRVYAEDPNKNFQPSTGVLTHVALPDGARCDTFIESGTEIGPNYDPLLAKIMAHGATRAEALATLRGALSETRVDGLESNLDYLRQILGEDGFARGGVTTRYLTGLRYRPATIDVIAAGTQTTVQDYPGRIGLWAIGVPPSGPVDDYAFRIANRLVGNSEGAPALEITLSGPTLVFNRDALIALTGADMGAELDGAPLPRFESVPVKAGSKLALGLVRGGGVRAYLAVRGGLDVPAYLGSAATFMLGRFGGHGGRALRAGDVLHLGDETRAVAAPGAIPPELVPAYSDQSEIAVLYGPHGAPDFFTPEAIDELFAATWKVHHNSDRTGIRLIGPKPKWAREDGGEAGLHPSNIHDNAYAVGTVDYTGDMPIILGPDGPSLGGFVCPVTIAKAECWKIGQLKAGDRVRFVPVSDAEAEALLQEQKARLDAIGDATRGTYGRAGSGTGSGTRGSSIGDAVLAELPAQGERPRVVYRRAGDDYVLVEYGPLELDLGLRLRAHLLMSALETRGVPGIVDLTPGIRSLQVHFAPERLSQKALLALLQSIERDLPSPDEIELPTRIVHMPLSYEDPATLEAIDKYMRVVRADAPWCPSNIEFIRRINGLPSRDDVRKTVFDASYLVLGLGDVYLGAPVATPLDPRHRLVTTKYNPARTWTPENAVGIGGAYMCIYGMEGPGGYQFVGRTVQVWNTHRVTREFAAGSPWLLRFFDQIRFYPVEAEELLAMREAFPQGRLSLRIEPASFHFGEYRAFLQENAASIAAFRAQQRAAFVAERERWREQGQDLVTPESLEADLQADPGSAIGADDVAADMVGVRSPVAGNVWKLLVQPGDLVSEAAQVAIIEAMKTEIAVQAGVRGRVREVRTSPGGAVAPGQLLAVIEPE